MKKVLCTFATAGLMLLTACAGNEDVIKDEDKSAENIV